MQVALLKGENGIRFLEFIRKRVFCSFFLKTSASYFVKIKNDTFNFAQANSLHTSIYRLILAQAICFHLS